MMKSKPTCLCVNHLLTFLILESAYYIYYISWFSFIYFDCFCIIFFIFICCLRRWWFHFQLFKMRRNQIVIMLGLNHNYKTSLASCSTTVDIHVLPLHPSPSPLPHASSVYLIIAYMFMPTCQKIRASIDWSTHYHARCVVLVLSFGYAWHNQSYWINKERDCALI